MICFASGIIFYSFTLSFEIAFPGIILDQNFTPVKSFPGGDSVAYVVYAGLVLCVCVKSFG